MMWCNPFPYPPAFPYPPCRPPPPPWGSNLQYILYPAPLFPYGPFLHNISEEKYLDQHSKYKLALLRMQKRSSEPRRDESRCHKSRMIFFDQSFHWYIFISVVLCLSCLILNNFLWVMAYVLRSPLLIWYIFLWFLYIVKNAP